MNTRIVSTRRLRQSAGCPNPFTSLLPVHFGATILTLLVGAFAPTAFAQSANDGFNPDVFGMVEAIVPQSDGKILIGGEFVSVGGIPRTNIARLNLDGTVDLSLDAKAAVGGVRKLEVLPDGRMVAAGFFETLGGQPRKYLGRISATG